MFITIVITICAFCAFLMLRDRVKYPRLSSKTLVKIQKNISHLIALHQWEEAENALLPLLAKGKGGKEVQLLYIHVLRGTKQYDKALQIISEAARKCPEELLFRLEEARLHLEKGSAHDALAAFQVCAPILRSENDFFEWALAYFQAGKWNACADTLETWIPYSQNGKLFQLAGDCSHARKKYSEAIQHYQKALSYGFCTHHLLTQLGHAYRKIGDLQQAEKTFRKILTKDESDIKALLGLGACLQERGHFQKALLLYQSSPAWSLNDPSILKQAGLCALHTKKYAFATFYFNEVILKIGYSASDLFYLALSLEKQEKWQEAEQAYLQLTKHFPEDDRSYRALAWLFGVGLSVALTQEEGIKCAYEALKRSADPITWEIVSACEARKGNFQRAHQIQEQLFAQETDKATRQRRMHALRQLRKNLPLNDHLVIRSLVA